MHLAIRLECATHTYLAEYTPPAKSPSSEREGGDR
jgi:hypothetical protein